MRITRNAAVLLVASAVSAGVLTVGAYFAPVPLSGDDVDLNGRSTAELLKLPRNSDVCLCLLGRALSSETLESVLARLAVLRDESSADIVEFLVVRPHQPEQRQYSENICWLASQLEEKLQAELCGRMFQLLQDGEESAPNRLLACGVYLSAGGDFQPLRLMLQNRSGGLADMFTAAALIPSVQEKRDLYAAALEFLKEFGPVDAGGSDKSTISAAVRALESLGQGDQQLPEDLADLICSEDRSAPAIQAFCRISAEDWPKERLGHVAAGVLAWLAEHRSVRDEYCEEVLRCAEQLETRFTGRKQERLKARLQQLRL
ncbi:MAG: hypothetical protein R3C49_12435 [Planctomycetaceae bacterium]